jgi:transporter family-2 protein
METKMYLLYGFAVLAGMLNALQAGANATLSKSLATTYPAALVVVAVSATSLLAAGLISGQLAWPSGERLNGTPWWSWTGGVMGATVVMSQLLVAQRVGAAPYLSLTVTAAVMMSIVLDHFGLMGFKEHPVTISRVLGGMLMIAGVGLIARN